MGGSTFLRPTTSISIARRRRCPRPVCADTRDSRSHAAHQGCRGARTFSIATAGTARSPMCRNHPASLARAAPTGSASRRWTSTTMGGSTSTSPTTRIRARSTATTTMGRSPTSPPLRGAPTARTESRRPAWDSPSATTIATARWTSSRPTSPAIPRRCTRIPVREHVRTEHSPAVSGSIRGGWAGASASSTSTATAGSISSSSTAMSIPRCGN